MSRQRGLCVLIVFALILSVLAPSGAFAKTTEPEKAVGSWPLWRNTNTLQGHQENSGDIVEPRESTSLFVSGSVDTSPFIADINGDGEKEIIMIDSARVTALGIDGTELWMTGVMQATQVYDVKDLDNDGSLEILVWGDKKMIILDAETGTVLHVEEFADSLSLGRFVLEDFDKDGNYEAVIYIYKHSYLSIYKFSNENGIFKCELANRIIDTRSEGEGSIAAFSPGLAAEDVNNDGYKELVVIRAYGLDVYDGVQISKVVKVERKFDPIAVESVVSDGDYGSGYPALNLIDGDDATYWIGTAEAEVSSLEFTLNKAANIGRIRTYNMYALPITAYSWDYVKDDWVEVGSSSQDAYNFDESTQTYGHEINFANYVFTDKIKLVVGKGAWTQPQGGEVRFFGENILAPILPSKLEPAQIESITSPEDTAGRPLDILINGDTTDYWWGGPTEGGKTSFTFQFKSKRTLSAVKFHNLIVPYTVVEGWDESESKWVELAKTDSDVPVIIGTMSFLSTFTTDAIRIRVERSNFGVYDDDMHHVQLSEVEFFEMNPVITPTDAIAVKGGHYPGLPPANAIDGDPGTYFISGRWPKEFLEQDGFEGGKFYSELEIELPPQSVIGKIVTEGFFNKITLYTSDDNGATWDEVASAPYTGAATSGLDFSDNPLIVPDNNKVRIRFSEGPYTDGGYDVHDTTHGTGSPQPATPGRLAVSVQGAEITFYKPVSAASEQITALDSVNFTPHLADNGRNYGHLEIKDLDGDGKMEIVALNDGVSYHISVYESVYQSVPDAVYRNNTVDIELFGDQYFGYSGQTNPDDGAPGRFAGGRIPYLKVTKNSVVDVNNDGTDEIVYGVFTYEPGESTGEWKVYVADSRSYDAANWKFNDIAVLDGYYLYDIAYILPDPGKPVFVMSRENTMAPKGDNPYELFVFENGSFEKLTELSGVSYVRKAILTGNNISPASGASNVEMFTPDVDGDGQNEMIIRDGQFYKFVKFINDGTYSVVSAISSELGVPVDVYAKNNGDVLAVTAVGGVMHLVTLDGDVLWRRTSGGELPVVPTVGDIDGDNKNEMVFSHNGTIYAYRMSGGKMEQLFTLAGNGKTVPGSKELVVPLIDMDGDGNPDIVSITKDGTLHVIQVHDGSGNLMWNNTIENDAEGNSLGVFTIQDYIVGDVTGDGTPDIIIAAGTTYPNGRTLIIGGAEKELIYASPLTVKIGRGAGNSWDRSTLPNPGSYSLADVNKDGVDEIYFVALEGYMRINYESDGTFSLNSFYPQIDSYNTYIYYATPIFTDIDGDGELEHILSGGFNSFTVYTGDIITEPIVWPVNNAEWHILMPPTAYNSDGTVKNRGDNDLNAGRRLQGVADVDGDGKMEIGIQFSTGIEGEQYAGFMHCYEGEGTEWTDSPEDVAARNGQYAWDNYKSQVKWKYDMRPEFGGQNVIANSIVTGDIDGDGRAEFVVSTNTGYLVVFNGEDDPEDGRVLWSVNSGGGTKLGMPVIADVDNDGYSEIIVSAGDGAIHIIDGEERSEQEPSPTATPTPTPTTAPEPSETPEPTTTPVPTTTPAPEQDEEEEYEVTALSIEADVSPDGAASANVESDIFIKLIDNAKEDETTGQRVVVELSVDSKDAKSVTLGIPGSALKQMADATESSLRISTGLATVTFDSRAVEAISSNENAENIKVSIDTVDKDLLSDEAREKVGDRPVYDFKILADDTGISDLMGGKAEIHIPYTQKPGEKENSIVVYHIDSEGNLGTIRGKYNKETGTVSFTLSHFSVYAVGYNEVNFNDVSESEWYNEAVGFLAARGIVKGIGNNNFAPGYNVTRADFLIMVMNSFGIEADSEITDNFDDAGDKYYTPYLGTAKQLGLVLGIGNNKYAPELTISRQEMFVILYRILENIGEMPAGDDGRTLESFKDVDEIADYAIEAIETLVISGVISGDGEKLLPGATSSRAEAAQVLYNILSK